MKDFSLLRKYVDALYDTAVEKGSLKSVDESLRAFTALLSEKPEVVSVLESNASKKAKKEFLSNLSVASDSGINPLFLNMMFLVIDNNRCHFFGKLLSAWEHQVSTKEHVWKAQIYTSVAADDGMKKAIEKYLAECEPGSKFICEYLIDAQLIGGFRIKTKNRIYDDSVSGKLERIRKHLLGRARQ